MKLSVVIPSYNRLDRLQRVLKALVRQTVSLDQFETIVVTDGCTDGSDQFLAAYDPPFAFTHLPQTNQGPAVARNNGTAAAQGQIVLFIDDDVIPEPNLIAEHLKWHERYGKNIVVMGPMLTPPDFKMQPWVQWEQAMLMKQYDAMSAGDWQPTARQFYTGNTSLAVHHIRQAGGFDPAFKRGEDVELAYRLADRGLRFLFNAAAIGYHYAERSFESWSATPYAYGGNDVILTRDKGQKWLLPTMAREFHGRHSIIQTLTRICLDRFILSQTALAALKVASQIGGAFSLGEISRFAYSGIFNLRYYQGVVEQLGGRTEFMGMIAAAKKDLESVIDERYHPNPIVPDTGSGNG